MAHVTVESLRSVLNSSLNVAAVVAGFTPTPVDDRTVKVLQAVVANDEAMALFAALVDRLLHRMGTAEQTGQPVDMVAELKGSMSHVAANVA